MPRSASTFCRARVSFPHSSTDSGVPHSGPVIPRTCPVFGALERQQDRPVVLAAGRIRVARVPLRVRRLPAVEHHGRDPAQVLAGHVEVLLDHAQVRLELALRAAHPLHHGLLVAEVRAPHGRDVERLVRPAAPAGEGAVEQCQVRVRPHRHAVAHGHGIGRLENVHVRGARARPRAASRPPPAASSLTVTGACPSGGDGQRRRRSRRAWPTRRARAP